MRPTFVPLAIVTAGVALDQLAKAWARAALDLHVPVDVAPFLALRLGFNTGISFGLFATDTARGRLVLIVLAALMIGGVGWWALRTRNPVERLGLAGILAGAIGNVVDRLRHGAVTDFLDVHAGGWHWPTFNLADVWITLGVALLLLAGQLSHRA